MRIGLRLTALMIALLASVLWFFSGPNFGWTKTSVLITRTDPVTGLEERLWEKRFLPGIDSLAAGLLTSLFLYGSSFFFGRKPARLAANQDADRPA